MADRNQRKIASQQPETGEDPFAELTRIMGFDPREPVQRQSAEKFVPLAVQPATYSASAPVAAAPMRQTPAPHDYTMDLERELLGVFGPDEEDEEDELTASDLSPADEDVAQSSSDLEFAFEQEFGDALEADEPEQPVSTAALDQPAQPVELPAEPAVHDLAAAQPAVQADDADEMFEELSGLIAKANEPAFAEVELEPQAYVETQIEAFDVVAAEPEAVEEEPEPAWTDAFSEEFDAAFAVSEPAIEAAEIVAEPVAALQAEEDMPAPFAGPQADIETSDVVEGDDIWSASADADAPVEQAEQVPVEAALRERFGTASDDDLAAEFDMAMANVDMDFSASADPATAAQNIWQDAEPEAPADDLDAMAFDMADDLQAELADDAGIATEAGDIELGEFDLIADEAPVEAAQPVDAHRPLFGRAQPVVAAVANWDAAPKALPDEHVEYSLEDELNALLGNPVAARMEDATAAEAVPYAGEAYAEARLDDAEDLAGAEDAVAAEPEWDLSEVEAAGEPEDAALYDELSLDPQDLHDFVQAGDTLEAGPAANYAETPYETEPDAVQSYADDRPYAYDQQGQFEAQPDDGLPAFDDDAFDAALAIGLDDELNPPADEPYYAEEPEAGPAYAQEPEREDPLDVINALSAKYAQPAGSGAAYAYHGQSRHEAPDIETIDVADQAIVLADDLDIPDIKFEDSTPPASDFDDLDTEFENLLSDMNSGSVAEPVYARQAHAPVYRDEPADNAGGDDYDFGLAAGTPAYGEPGYDDGTAQSDYALDVDNLPGSQPLDDDRYDFDGYDDADADDHMPAGAVAEREQPRGRGMLIAAIVGGVAIAGGLGAFALSFGDGIGSDTPAIVMADDGPVKVRPENPGGTTVPNQENKVYETVRGGNQAGPKQDTLVTTAEEPVDVPPPMAEAEPRAIDIAPDEADEGAGSAVAEAQGASPKGEDRIEQLLQESESVDPDTQVAAVAPRKVRTMVVKPDGTLVPREDPPAPAAAAPAAVAPAADAAAAPPPTEAAPATAAAPLPETVDSVASTGAITPDSVPVAPTRPAQQPLDVVGEVKADKVAAISPSAVAPAGAWSMQIASQPSEAAAQSSYQDLARRYASVLGGREVNIVKAEITGKGTFWRVRVPAKTRNDAVSLCENYKAAGGNCFVSR